MRKYISQELAGNKPKNDKLTSYDMNVYFKLNLLKDLESERGNSRREIRKMLHPTLDEHQLPKDNERVAEKHVKMNTLFSNKKRLKVDPKFYSRFKEFQKMPPSDFDTPVIWNSSPYISEEELKRKEYMESKKKWTAPEQFRTYFNKATNGDNFIPNYVTITPSEPPILHKFRSVKKEDWICDENFKF